jgi:multidrug efflux system outer membrane protein
MTTPRNSGRSRSRAPRLAGAGFALVVLATLGGCFLPKVGPDYKRPTPELPAAFRTDPGEAAEVTNHMWWYAFGDANLNALVDEALVANSDLLIAAARIEQYDAKLEVSHSHYYPQIGYDASAYRDERSQEVPELLRPGQPPTFNDFTGALTINYEVDLWGKIRRQNEETRAEMLSTEQARNTVMLTVVSAVAGAYIELMGRDRELEIARQKLDSLKASVALMDEKYRGGSATDIEVDRLRSEMEDEAAAIPGIEREIQDLEDSISELLGRNPGPVKRGKLADVVAPSVPAGVPSDVLSRRPDVMGAEQDLIAANARIGVAKGKYFPTFALTGLYGQSSDLTQWLLAKTARIGFGELDLAGPILSFGKIEGEVREARAETKAQREHYLQTIRTALKEVDEALVYNVKSADRVAALDRALAAREQVDRISDLRFKGGSYTKLDVLDADRKVYDAENEQLTATRDHYLALISVYKAMGGGWMVEQDDLLAAKQKQSASAAPVKAPPAPETPSSTTDVAAK